MWFVASSIGVVGLIVTLGSIATLGYAAISHLRRADKKVPWLWRAGIVPVALRSLLVGALLQAISLAGRLALGGS